jgi:hypothetical protein
LVSRRLAGLPDSDEVEGFSWQLESSRRYVDELPPTQPEVSHLNGILTAVADIPARESDLRVGLTAYAYFLEYEGRFAEALDILALAARAYGENVSSCEFVRLALMAARLNRLLAQWDAALAAYAVAEQGAAVLGDVPAGYRARLGRAAVARGRGDLPGALAAVEAVLAEAQRLGLRDICGDAYQDLGAIYGKLDRPVEAVQMTYQAFLHTEDQLQQMRILGDLGTGLLDIGAKDVARIALEIVAASNASFSVRTNAILELMTLEANAGNRVGFERYRQQAEAAAERMPPSMAVDCCYKVALGFAHFGQIARAQRVIREAQALAEAHRLNEWYFRLERVLDELATRGQPPADERAARRLPAEADYAPAVAEMESGLREFSAALH